MNSENVIFAKLNKGKRLTVNEIEWLRRGVRQYKKTHTYWKTHPAAVECMQCNWLEFRYQLGGTTPNNDYKYFRFCPSCGAKIVTRDEYTNNVW